MLEPGFKTTSNVRWLRYEPLKNAYVLACTLGYTTFETAQALLSNMICGFKTRFVSISQRLFKLFCCLIKIQLYIGAYKS